MRVERDNRREKGERGVASVFLALGFFVRYETF